MGQVTASARVSFRTSGELLDHRRAAHGVEDEAEGGGGGNGTGLGGLWLYRCALRGCGKGWKVRFARSSLFCVSRLHESLRGHRRRD